MLSRVHPGAFRLQSLIKKKKKIQCPTDLYNTLPPALLPYNFSACQTCSRERIHQVPDSHREAPGHLADQRAEDPAAHLRAVAAEPQAASACLAPDGWLRPSRSAGAPHAGSRAQLQGQGEHGQGGRGVPGGLLSPAQPFCFACTPHGQRTPCCILQPPGPFRAHTPVTVGFAFPRLLT